MSVRLYCRSTIARPRRALALGLGSLALGLIWPGVSLASPTLSGTTLTASTEVANIEACLDPVGEITHGISHSGSVAGPYAGTFDGFINMRQASEGGPVRTVNGDYTLTDDADAEYAKARVVLTFDSGIPSSCNSSGFRPPVDYDIDVVAAYSAYLVMDDGRICAESGDAAVSATGTSDGTTASGSMTVTLGPPPDPGGDISCSTPTITATPSSGLPRKRSQRVTIDGTGFAPGQNVTLSVCNAFMSDPLSCPFVDVVQADQTGSFSGGYFSSGVHHPVSCDDGGGGGAPCRIVAVDGSLNMPLSPEASISYAAYPTVTTVGASTTVPDTLEVTGTNLDQFRWLEMLTGCNFFSGAPWLQDTPGYMNPPGTVINEWSASRISITWPTQRLNQCGRQVQQPLRFSDEIRDDLVVPASFNIPAEIDPWRLGPGETALVSRATGAGGTKGDGGSYRASASGDGRFVAFTSDSANLDPDDADTTSDVYVRDLQDNTTTLVSRATGVSGAKGDSGSDHPSISADGRYVAFSSNASNLDPDDTDGNIDVFVRDLQQNTTTLVSRASGASGAKGNGNGSSEPSLSPDGGSVAFTSNSTNLDPDDTDAASDIYLRDLQQNTTKLVSRATGATGSKGNNFSFQPSVSDNGGSVAFTSDASNLDPGDTESTHDIFVRDLQQNTTTLASRATGASGANGDGVEPWISGNGQLVSFTAGGHLDPDDSDANNDVYVRDLQQATTILVSRATGANGPNGNDGAVDSSVSQDGRFIAFRSGGSNLHPDDGDTSFDVFVRDLQQSTTELVSRAAGAGGAKANDLSFDSSIAPDGSSVAFSSTASNLDPGDTDSTIDVFLRDRRSFDSASGDAPAGGTVSTNTTTSAEDPIGTSVTTPVAGAVTIAEGATATPDPSGFTLFGQEVQITAPDASSSQPLVLQFRLDDSLLPVGGDETNVEVFRNGILVADCDSGAGTSATPDPCVAGRTATASGIELTVRTSQASTWNFGLDSAPPNTTITSGPSGPTNDSTPTYGFSSNEPGSSFECRFDAAPFAACSGPATHTPASTLGDGDHTFEVRAVDQAHNADPSPSSRSFTVDTVAPNTTITAGPTGKINDPSPTFSFSSVGGTSFQCRVDTGTYTACTSPKTIGPLADGAHTFYVRARDAAGNLDPTPSTRSITVETASVAVSGATLVVTAATGTKDNFQITRPSPSVLRVTDLAAGPYTGSGIHTGAGCTRSGDYTANCSASGITVIRVSAGNEIDRVVNATGVRGSFDGGADNDTLTGGSGGDSLTGGAGADVMKGMDGNDQLFARDFVSDTTIACDGGATPGTADKADLDLQPKDPNSVVTGCETKTRH